MIGHRRTDVSAHGKEHAHERQERGGEIPQQGKKLPDGGKLGESLPEKKREDRQRGTQRKRKTELFFAFLTGKYRAEKGREQQDAAQPGEETELFRKRKPQRRQGRAE